MSRTRLHMARRYDDVRYRPIKLLKEGVVPEMPVWFSTEPIYRVVLE